MTDKDKTVGGQTRPWWEALFEKWLPGLQSLHDLLDEAFEGHSRGLRDGLERAAKLEEALRVAVDKLEDIHARHRVIDYGNRRVCSGCPGQLNGCETAWPCGTVDDCEDALSVARSTLDALPARAEASKLDRECGNSGPRGVCRLTTPHSMDACVASPEPPAEERKLPHRFAPPQDAEDDRCQFCFGCTINETGDHTCSGKRKCGQPRSAHEPRESS